VTVRGTLTEKEKEYGRKEERRQIYEVIRGTEE
jgi:hypothetical protein